MTEEEWLTATDPTSMLSSLGESGTDRKHRLFGCACVRRVWALIGENPPSAVQVAEDYADKVVSKGTLRRERRLVQGEREMMEMQEKRVSPRQRAYWLAETVSTITAFRSVITEMSLFRPDESPLKANDWALFCEFSRCIFGNPFRPVAVDPSWLTPTVVALAEAIYADRAFDRMPVLADALEEAGCDNPDVLTHCRGDGPHVRGCWVVDLVLGKR